MKQQTLLRICDLRFIDNADDLSDADRGAVDIMGPHAAYRIDRDGNMSKSPTDVVELTVWEGMSDASEFTSVYMDREALIRLLNNINYILDNVLCEPR